MSKKRSTVKETKSSRISVRVPEDTYNRIETIAKNEGLDSADIVRRAVRIFLDQIASGKIDPNAIRKPELEAA